MPFLTQKSTGTRAALKHPSIAGLPVIGKGSFSLVFDAGDTVMKLTIDPSQYEFYTSPFSPEGSWKPKLIADFDVIGEQYEYPLFLVEMEKLTPIKRKDDCPKHIWEGRRAIVKAMERHWGEANKELWEVRNPLQYRLQMNQSVIAKINRDESIDPKHREILNEIGDFCSNHEAVFDLHVHNFMRRGDELIFNDPLTHAEISCANESKRIIRLN